MRVSLLPRLIATFAAQHGGVKLREKRSEASGHLLSSLLNYLSSRRGMKTDKAGPGCRAETNRERVERNANKITKHSRARTGSLVMESQQVKRARPSDGSTGHRPYYAVTVCWRGTVLGIGGGAPPTPCWDPLWRQTDRQMEELRGPFLEKKKPCHLLRTPTL
ncbi:hypothetical protein Q7C36_016658 [Tachysurus vachellii]|uniref:Uncharacterized protein n=1 Tax=Tachysurus vachellii TaxID=175792 RepID=A0AA88MA22_TACVA|nr:hypothetical protein Q7C36_016658 [Tachysurus vachellii]